MRKLRLRARLGDTSILLVISAAVLAAGCSGPNVASQVAKPPEFAPKDQSKCGVTKSQARPLIVEWPSADRAALESQAKRGLVAVHYVGCEMEVLRQCRAPGRYAYTGITRKHDRVTMRDEDELYANIPAYAAKFEGKLQKAGQLNVNMTIVGTYEAVQQSMRPEDLEGDCQGATHVVTALTAGSFEFFAGADATAGAEVNVAGAGAGAKSSSSRELLNQDGDEKACEKATTKDSEPPDGCGALLRVEVAPLLAAGTAAKAPAAGPAAVKPGAAARAPASEGCPAGMASVPGGSFKMGERQVTIPDYCMDVTEVTASAYTECVKGAKCDGAGLSCGALATYGASSRKDYPINCVDFTSAAKYCDAQDKRLPSDEEWEWAARDGAQGWLYPWGNDTPVAQLCWGGAGKAETCVAGSFPKGDSSLGIHDLAGNVWEWTATPFDSKGALRTIRGGSFADAKAELIVSSKRIPNRSTDRNVNLGFRCAKSK